jgi:hypothetical protein
MNLTRLNMSLIKKIIPFLLIIFLVICIANVGCKKKQNKISIRGYLFDPKQNISVAGALVTISSSKISSGVYNSNYQDIATTTTDASGNFSFDFTEAATSGYRFYIRKDKYFDYTVDVSADDITHEQAYTPTFNLYPEAYLKLEVKNTTPYDSADFISFRMTTGFLECYQCCTNTIFKGYGETYDTIMKCKTYGSSTVTLNWTVTKNALPPINHNQNVYCTPYDTTFYQISY